MRHPVPTRRRATQGAFSPLCALGLLLSLSATPALADNAGQIKRMEGDVRIIRAGQTLTAYPGHDVRVRDRIVTGANGAVGFTTTDSGMFTLGPNSHMAIDDYAYDRQKQDGNIAVRFLKGTFGVISGFLSKLGPEKTRIQTPTATIGIRGTEFSVKVDLPAEVEEEVLGLKSIK